MLGRSDDENQSGMLLHLWVVRDEASAKKESCERGAYYRGPTDWHNLFMTMYEAKQSVRCIHSARLYVRELHDLHRSENGPRRLSRHYERTMVVGVARASKASFRSYNLCTDKSNHLGRHGPVCQYLWLHL